MIISIVTLFPEVFEPILNSSILKRAQTKSKIKFQLINLRDFGDGSHKSVDDRPYGGGAGMILRVDVLSKAIIATRHSQNEKTILMSASGNQFKQQKAQQLSKLDHLIIICGHYEGVDQRFIESYVDEEISIGDYVLTGGEIPAMVVVDAITRLLPGVLEKEEATVEESFNEGLLEYPHYTRPEEFEGEKVPKVLLSGDHKKIADWRNKKAIEKTKKIRPDLLP